MLSPKITRFVDLVQAASRTAEVGEAFQHFSGDLGYTEFLILDALKLSDRLEPAIVCGTPRTKSSVLAQDRKSPLGAHPLIQAARKTDQPFRCEDLRKSVGFEAAAWRAASPVERCDAIFPVHRKGALVMLVSAAGERPDVSDVAQAALHVCAHVAYERLNALRLAEQAHRGLTKREAACLRWVSEGKTDSQVGGILNIAPRTVRFHIANAKRKLGAGSRLEAVAKKVGDFER